ncbi:MAG: hypothetical protein WAJ86_00680, partial [Candidatus Acidiferrales bacterium]
DFREAAEAHAAEIIGDADESTTGEAFEAQQRLSVGVPHVRRQALSLHSSASRSVTFVLPKLHFLYVLIY